MAQPTYIDPSVLQGGNILTIENDCIRLGVNLGLGGAVTSLCRKGGPNLINSYDWGRQVQMSFYSYPTPYLPQGKTVRESWKFLGWNPIQSGDCFGHRSRILEHRCTDNEIYVRCIPMHWPLDNVPGECTFETWYRLNGTRVDVTARLNNARPETVWSPARGQELPAVYTNGEWYKLVSYTGAQPFTGGPVSALCTRENGLGWPWVSYLSTEHWAALVNDENEGLGVYNGGVYHFIGGFFGEKGTGGPKDVNTGYISPVSEEILDRNIEYTYQYSLIVGSVEDIRRTAAELTDRAAENTWRFAHSRCHFTYRNIADAGWPVGDCLDFSFDPSGALVSPTLFCGAGSLHELVLDAALEGGELPCTVRLTLYDDEVRITTRENRPHDTLDVPCTLSCGGGRRLHTIPLPEVRQPVIGFELLFRGSGHANVYAAQLR